MKKQRHSIEELKSVLEYLPEIGRFRWLVDRTHQVKSGDEAGGFRPDGYRVLCYKKVGYREHILAWAFCYNEWPALDLDHRDGNPSNNRIDNLRLATKTQNLTHCRVKKSNKLGIKGVIFHQGWYRAQITFKRKTTSIGKFTTAEEAHLAYMEKAKEIYGEFARAK